MIDILDQLMDTYLTNDLDDAFYLYKREKLKGESKHEWKNKPERYVSVRERKKVQKMLRGE
jgi:hypothetical protein